MVDGLAPAHRAGNLVRSFLVWVLLPLGCVPGKAEVTRSEVDNRTPVEVMVATVGRLVERGDYYGLLEPAAAVMVAAEAGGRAVEVTVERGGRVTPGQLLVRIEEEPYRLAEEAASHQLAAASVRVEQLERAIEMERKSLAAGLLQAEAAVDQARAHVRLVESGARPEEKQQARAGVEAARAGMENGRTEFDRLTSLLAEGAATQQMVDGARTAFESAAARHDQAQQIYRVALKGARAEDKEAARAGLRQAEAAQARAEASLEQLSVREKELEAARIAVEAAANVVEQARFNRRKITLVSPLDGEALVAVRNIDVGEMVAPGVPLLELLDVRTMRLQLQIPGRDIAFLNPGQLLPVRCQGDPAGERTGKVRYAGVKAELRNTSFPVEVELDNGDGKLRAGQLCEAFPDLQSFERILLPRSAVLDTEEGKLVVVVEEGVARERPVGIATVRQGIAAIESGLSQGESVVVVGERLVRDGEPVQVVATHPPTSPDGAKEE